MTMVVAALPRNAKTPALIASLALLAMAIPIAIREPGSNALTCETIGRTVENKPSSAGTANVDGDSERHGAFGSAAGATDFGIPPTNLSFAALANLPVGVKPNADLWLSGLAGTAPAGSSPVQTDSAYVVANPPLAGKASYTEMRASPSHVKSDEPMRWRSVRRFVLGGVDSGIRRRDEAPSPAKTSVRVDRPGSSSDPATENDSDSGSSASDGNVSYEQGEDDQN